MRTEREKMLAGEWYDPYGPDLTAARHRARDLCRRLNASTDADPDGRARLVRELIGSVGDGAFIEPPFFCDYGTHIALGRKVFFNFNCVVLDCAEVSVGDFTLFGPGVQLLTPVHPIGAADRRAGLEAAKPIRIGADVWVGGGAVVLPGVTVGDGAVIGAGSVVTKDVPAGVVAVGNPCRVVRRIEEPGK